MPSLAVEFTPNPGPLIPLGVLPPGLVVPTGMVSQMYQALVDTGAARTCISSHCAQAVGIQPVGMVPMISATQRIPVRTYLIDLVFSL